MTTFVLLHGGGAGGWMWRYVAPSLVAAGHTVYTPTFTGVGERRHLSSRDVTHWTHVQDVSNILEFEEIEDAVLVGYSYGGGVIPGVVAEQSGRVAKAILLDALVVRAGEAISQAMGYMDAETVVGLETALKAGQGPMNAETRKIIREEAEANPHNMSAERQAWMVDKITDFPLRCMVDPVRYGADSLRIPVEYLAVPETTPMLAMHQRAKDLGWNVSTTPVECDHSFPFGQPEIVVDFLLRNS